MGVIALIARYRAWRVSYALLEQGATSLGSLALQIALARILAPDAFGSYAVAIAIQAIAALVIYAVVLEPMHIIGARYSGGEQRLYLSRTLAALVVASVCASAVLAAAAMIAASFNEQVGYALIGGALGLPGIALGWFARRAAYLKGRLDIALVNGAAATVLLLIGVLALYAAGMISPAAALVLQGLAGGLAAFWPLRSLGIRARPAGRLLSSGTWLVLMREHWPISRWGLLNASSVSAWRDLYAPILAIGGGLEIAAVHRAAAVIALPIAKFGESVDNYLQPIVSRAALDWTPSQVVHLLRWVFGIVAGLALTAALLLWPLMPPLVELVFQDPVYTENSGYFFVFSLLTVVFVLVDASVNTLMRALGRVDLVFWPAFSSGMVAAFLGLIGALLAGLPGAAFALVASTIAFAAATIVACVRLARSGAALRL